MLFRSKNWQVFCWQATYYHTNRPLVDVKNVIGYAKEFLEKIDNDETGNPPYQKYVEKLSNAIDAAIKNQRLIGISEKEIRPSLSDADKALMKSVQGGKSISPDDAKAFIKKISKLKPN